MKSSKPDILKFVARKKTKFYRRWWHRWGNRTLNPFQLGYGDYQDNPNLFTELVQIRQSLILLGWKEQIDFVDCELIHKKYRERFVREYASDRAIKEGWPHENKTKAIWELIRRGWVHKDEPNFKKGNVIITCHIAPLVWPKSFYQHQDALDILNRYGIPGYTGTILPKS